MSADYGYNAVTMGNDEPLRLKHRVEVSQIRRMNDMVEVTFNEVGDLLTGFVELYLPPMVAQALHINQEFVLLLSEVRTIKADNTSAT
jgi:hypothetical protein